MSPFGFFLSVGLFASPSVWFSVCLFMSSEDYMNQGAALLEDVKAYNYILRKDDAPASLDGVNLVTDTVSRLDVSAVPDSNPKPTAEQIPILGIVECKCGMPLCICEAPVPSRDAVTLPNKSTTTSTAQSNPKPKKTDTSLKNRGSTSNNKQLYVSSEFFSLHFVFSLT
ncbi:hypothetical protein TEA_028398 [Camellia sinensis var. sinensis]|uniref:Uncharacterized protein n=1 Tax=Camellia sinensis var. sinensis TaxID=542762 RepID=A0A4S4D3B6_CAMSN|nr:hypothetical protein TEA_028398 [Camellia sinensis var. sinensis]